MWCVKPSPPGIKEIVLVTHSSKNSIENHFDKSFRAGSHAGERVKRQLLAEVQSICPKDVTIMHVRQGEAKGLGHAIRCAHPLVGDAPFVVLLPDVLIDEASCDLKVDNLATWCAWFAEDGISPNHGGGIPNDEVDQYGIANINGEALTEGHSAP